MIRITKQEKEYLESQGCVYEEELHHTVGKGRKKTYYATESKKILNMLFYYRKSRLAN